MTLAIRSDIEAGDFRDRVHGYLMRDEPRHNLMLGLLRVLVDDPDAYDEHRLWLVERHGADEAASDRADGGPDHEVVAVAIITPPRALILAAPEDDSALECLIDHFVEDVPRLPGVVGALPEVDRFADAYLEATGGTVSARMDQGLFVLEQVADLAAPEGRARRARTSDVERCVRWFTDFHDEAIPREPLDPDQLRRSLQRRLGGEGSAELWLWEHEGEAVSLAGYRLTSPNGGRVGPVYTPPAFRGRGYATALVADVSRHILSRGSRFCFLYTDLANPTSNAIYRRIGYRQALTSAMLHFEWA